MKYIILCLCLCLCLLFLTSCNNAVHFTQEKSSDAMYESSGEQESDNIMYKRECFEGWFLRTDSSAFFIADGESDRFQDNEAIKIDIPSWEENVSFNFDDLHTGDRIAVEIDQIGDTAPRSMPVYSVDLLERGDESNIDDSTLTYLHELGYIIIENDD